MLLKAVVHITAGPGNSANPHSSNKPHDSLHRAEQLYLDLTSYPAPVEREPTSIVNLTNSPMRESAEPGKNKKKKQPITPSGRYEFVSRDNCRRGLGGSAC